MHYEIFICLMYFLNYETLPAYYVMLAVRVYNVRNENVLVRNENLFCKQFLNCFHNTLSREYS